MGDKTVEIFLQNILYNHSVKYLNLAYNKITEVGAVAIKNYLKDNDTLRVLSLHWNFLRNKGGQAIAEGMVSNQTLQVLDLSFCQIGSYRPGTPKFWKPLKEGKKGKKGKSKSKDKDSESPKKVKKAKKSPSPTPTEKPKVENEAPLTFNERIKLASPSKQKSLRKDAAIMWCQCFSQNTTLLHLNLSHNNLCDEELQIMSEGLERNHSLLGLHMEGNEGEVSADGFLKPSEDITQRDFAKESMTFTRIKPTKESHRFGCGWRRLEAVSNCWICEGWSNVMFRFTPQEEIDSKETEVKLHLECEEFKGQLLQPLARKDYNEVQVYLTERMLPPGKQRYYFTVGGQIQLNQESKTKGVEQTPQYLELEISKINYVRKIVKSDKFLTPNVLDSLGTRPRQPFKKANHDEITPFVHNTSVFAKFTPDEKKLVDECFNLDWISSKIDKLYRVTDPRTQKLKDFLQDNYHLIKDAYKHYSSMEIINGVPQITIESFVNFLHSLPTNFTLNLSNEEIETETRLVHQLRPLPNMPEDSLIRFKFMEALVRVSLLKYHKKGTFNQYDAVTIAFETHFLPFFTFDNQKYREQRIWRQENNLVLDRLSELTNAIFDSFVKKGQNQPVITLLGFQDLIEKANLPAEQLTSQKINHIFVHSIMTQVDEIGRARTMQMTFVEFLEGITRVADLLERETLINYFPMFKSQSPYYLDKKIESLVILLAKNCLYSSAHLIQNYGTLLDEFLAVKEVKFSFQEEPKSPAKKGKKGKKGKKKK